MILAAVAVAFGSAGSAVSLLDPTSEDILLPTTVALLGAIGLELLLGNSGTFDNLAASYLGAAVAIAILWLAKRVARRA
jgi:hypothetical protein